MIRLLDEHALTSPGLTGNWEQRLGKIERGEDSRKKFMSDIAGFAEETVEQLDEMLKTCASRGPGSGRARCAGTRSWRTAGATPVGRATIQAGAFVIWRAKAGKTLPLAVAKELIKTGYTAQAVTGFRGRSGRSFRRLTSPSSRPTRAMAREFSELWAKREPNPPRPTEGAARAPRRSPPTLTPPSAAPA